jgi:hypothetical protein
MLGLLAELQEFLQLFNDTLNVCNENIAIIQKYAKLNSLEETDFVELRLAFGNIAIANQRINKVASKIKNLQVKV